MPSNDSMQDVVYDYLRKQLIELTLAPGSALHLQELAERLQVSKSPIREALLRLQLEGLIVMQPKKETTVSKLSVKRVLQEYFMREALECACIREFAVLRTFNDLAAMNDCIIAQAQASTSGRYEDMLHHDRAFHRLVFARCNQLFSWETLDAVNTHSQRFGLLNFRSPAAAEQVISIHIRLLQAIENQSPDDAVQILHEHLHQHDSQIQRLLRSYPEYFAAE